MTLRGTGSRGRQGKFGERGAVAVEAAIVTPLVLALFFGIIELGFLFKDYLAVAGAVRAGVRTASATPRTATFAQDAANQVAQSGGAMNFEDVQQLWVYKVGTVAGGVTDKPCSKLVPTGPCAARSNFGDCTVCVKFRWDISTAAFVQTSSNWAASTQNACSASGPGGPPDRIGIYLKLQHDAVTNLVFRTVTLEDNSVLSLEPIPVTTGCR